jgi:hypothetical protein
MIFDLVLVIRKAFITLYVVFLSVLMHKNICYYFFLKTCKVWMFDKYAKLLFFRLLEGVDV